MNLRLAISASIGLCTVIVFLAGAQEKSVTRKDVPASVTSAFRKAYPNARIRGYAKEIEEGKTYYEIEGMNGKMTLDVLYLADGTLTEVEEGVAPADLPVLVKETVTAKHPGAKISRAERTTRGDAVTYELGLTSGKTGVSMIVDPGGKIVSESQPAANKEKSEERGQKEKDD